MMITLTEPVGRMARGQGLETNLKMKLKMADGSIRRLCFSFFLWLLQSSSLSYGDRKLRMVNVVGMLLKYYQFDYFFISFRTGKKGRKLI